MKKITFLLILLVSFLGFSQSEKEKIQLYLNSNYKEMGLTGQDVSDWFIESENSSENTGIKNYYIKQRFQGIEIFNAVSNVWMKNGEVINVGNQFVNNVNQKINVVSPVLTVSEGLNSAIRLLGLQNQNHHIIESADFKNFKISNGNLEPIVAELVYQLTDEDKLRLAWDFIIDVTGHQHLWNVRIDAVTGKLLEKHDMVISCKFDNHAVGLADKRQAYFNSSFFKNNSSFAQNIQSGSYRVIPYNFESPNHSPRQLITSPHNTLASPYGWHDTNGVMGAEYTITRGNNVYAQEDTYGINDTGYSPDGGSALVFDYPYGGTTVDPSTYIDAATTNLFYMNNIMHDVWYQHGFKEVNGNFQQNNYGRGGMVTSTGDAVFADAQDGSLLNPPNINNANFSTPVDGQRPRMQMYLWNVAPPIQPLIINSPSDIAGPREARDNAFSPGHVNLPVAPAFIQSNLVLFNDGTPDIGMTDNADACSPAINASAINGKIAVMRRSVSEANGGTPCSFVVKVKNAQNAGAIAAIVVNNVEGVISMSGADASINIPAISVTSEVGEALIQRMQIATVNAKIQLPATAFINTDGDFDNGVIAHEYGHGISNRLTGGPNNTSCLQNAEQAGEGWSDWFALMMQLKAGDVGSSPRGIGTFTLSQPTNGRGIRSFVYSTDMTVNPLTFNNSNNTQAHNRGEFMATVLWDLTWAYVDKYGFNSNIYTGNGGNNKVMKLVIDAMKLQPCSPTFIEFRSALIAADQTTTGGQDYCMITEVFRRRGMGKNASSGLRTSATDQIEDYTPFAPGPNCTLGINYFENKDMFTVYPNPTNSSVNIRINNYNGKADIQVVDVNGRVVYQIKENNFNVEKSVDLSHLQSGIYILKVSSADFNFTEKIVKK